LADGSTNIWTGQADSQGRPLSLAAPDLYRQYREARYQIECDDGLKNAAPQRLGAYKGINDARDALERWAEFYTGLRVTSVRTFHDRHGQIELVVVSGRRSHGELARFRIIEVRQ
jgi:hypothetical protein